MALTATDHASREVMRDRIFGSMLGSALGDCVGLFTGMIKIISFMFGARKGNFNGVRSIEGKGQQGENCLHSGPSIIQNFSQRALLKWRIHAALNWWNR